MRVEYCHPRVLSQVQAHANQVWIHLAAWPPRPTDLQLPLGASSTDSQQSTLAVLRRGCSATMAPPGRALGCLQGNHQHPARACSFSLYRRLLLLLPMQLVLNHHNADLA